MSDQTSLYKRHRYPPDIIQYAVWLYYRFNLIHRDIEDLRAERDITVSRESIRFPPSTTELRGRMPLCHGKKKHSIMQIERQDFLVEWS